MKRGLFTVLNLTFNHRGYAGSAVVSEDGSVRVSSMIPPKEIGAPDIVSAKRAFEQAIDELFVPISKRGGTVRRTFAWRPVTTVDIGRTWLCFVWERVLETGKVEYHAYRTADEFYEANYRGPL